MIAADRLSLAWHADHARTCGLPGAAERYEKELSEAMVADYRAWAAQDAERHIAEHHRRRPRLPGEMWRS